MPDSARTHSKRLKTIEVGCFLLIAAIVLADGLQFILNPARNLRAIEVGGYEILVGGLLAILALAYWLGSTPADWERVERSRVTAVSFGLLVAYGLCLQYLGYLVATFLAVATYMRLLGGYPTRVSLLFSTAFTLGSTWVWTTMLVNLPRGMFSTWLIW